MKTVHFASTAHSKSFTSDNNSDVFSYTINEFDKEKKELAITVDEINTNDTPGYAIIRVEYDSGSCTDPLPDDTTTTTSTDPTTTMVG